LAEPRLEHRPGKYAPQTVDAQAVKELERFTHQTSKK